MLKAYHVFVGHPMDSGSILVFETTRGKAKMYGFDLGADHFTEISAVRAKQYDEFIRGDIPKEFWSNNDLYHYNKEMPPFFITEEEWFEEQDMVAKDYADQVREEYYMSQGRA